MLLCREAAAGHVALRGQRQRLAVALTEARCACGLAQQLCDVSCCEPFDILLTATTAAA
jgi:hypothetical protein